jgi:hypothetical protein
MLFDWFMMILTNITYSDLLFFTLKNSWHEIEKFVCFILWEKLIYMLTTWLNWQLKFMMILTNIIYSDLLFFTLKNSWHEIEKFVCFILWEKLIYMLTTWLNWQLKVTLTYAFKRYFLEIYPLLLIDSLGSGYLRVSWFFFFFHCTKKRANLSYL